MKFFWLQDDKKPCFDFLSPAHFDLMFVGGIWDLKIFAVQNFYRSRIMFFLRANCDKLEHFYFLAIFGKQCDMKIFDYGVVEGNMDHFAVH